MKGLYIAWATLVGILMLSANSQHSQILGGLFDGTGGGGSSYYGGYSRGWGYGSGGGGYHK